MFVKVSLVFGFAFLGAFMVSGTWRHFRSHKRANGGPSEGGPKAPGPKEPSLHLLPLLGFDKIIAKYALGLENNAKFDGVPLDLAEGYYEIFESTGDADLASAQFTRSTILQLLRKRNDCKTVKVNRLMIVTIVTALQKALKPEIENLRPTIENLLVDLPNDIKGPLFGRILTVLGASILQSSISGIVGRSFPIEEVRQLKNNIAFMMENSTSLEDFEQILDTIPLFSSPVPMCPTMEDLSITYMEEIPNIKKAFSANILRSVAMIRGELGLKGIVTDDIQSIEQVFEALNPVVSNVIDGLGAKFGSGSSEDLRRFLKEFEDYKFELPDPMTGTVPPPQSPPSVFDDIKAKIDTLINVEGPLKELIRELTKAKLGE